MDLAIAADAEATLPSLIEACKRLITDDRKRAFQDRGAKLGEASVRRWSGSRVQASYGMGREPDQHRAHVSAELWAQIKNEDWSLVSDASSSASGRCGCGISNKHYQYIGGKGGEGIGYSAPAAVGAALANQKTRAPDRQHPERRRHDVCARRSVDGGAPPDSAAARSCTTTAPIIRK